MPTENRRAFLKRAGAALAEGEVITYMRDDGELITHRIQAALTASAIPAFRTKGDANPVADRQVVQQAEVGIDVVSDGEFGKAISWSQYALTRLSGFTRRPFDAKGNPWAAGLDREKFSEFYKEMDAGDPPNTAMDAIVTGPIKYTGQAELQADIDNFKAALKETPVEEAFLPVAAAAAGVAPDDVLAWDGNGPQDDCIAWNTPAGMINGLGRSIASQVRQELDGASHEYVWFGIHAEETYYEIDGELNGRLHCSSD